MEITIRPGRLSDVPAEAEMNKDVDWCYDERNMVAEYHDDAYEPSSVLIAEHNGEVVGKLELFIAWKSTHGKFALIRRFVVAPGWRGKGVGQELLDAAVDKAKQEGCAFVELSVDVTNPIPHAFYAREGFVEDRVEVLMRKPLTDDDVSSRYPREAP
ncbi:MAG: GNAT family N-acetyltransferase [Thermomicrobiales bacterium]